MDIEPLIRLLRHDRIVHGVSHTYLGATLIGLLSLLVGRLVCQWLLGYWSPRGISPLMDWLRGPRTISWSAALSGALIGTYSHVFLDSVMHGDMQPYWPLDDGNELLGVVTIGHLHLFCIAAGIMGAVALLCEYAVSSQS
jgi:membrane-bound metal-dependent hydrolase YbcI (DUF457 family)